MRPLHTLHVVSNKVGTSRVVPKTRLLHHLMHGPGHAGPFVGALLNRRVQCADPYTPPSEDYTPPTGDAAIDTGIDAATAYTGRRLQQGAPGASHL